MMPSWPRVCPGDHADMETPRDLQRGHRLCAECCAKYGEDPKFWPAWLCFLVEDDKRIHRKAEAERRYNRRHGDRPTICGTNSPTQESAQTAEQA